MKGVFSGREKVWYTKFIYEDLWRIANEKIHRCTSYSVAPVRTAPSAPGAAAAGPALTTTEAYCIIDADTGLVLAQQNMNEELHPASITKVMTLGLACEKAQGKWDDVKLT